MLNALLIVAGLLLLDGVSGTDTAPLLLLTVALVTYGAAALAARTLSTAARAWLKVLAVPAAFAVILTLNLTGLIGTLTGSQTNGLNHAMLLAAPFYLLAAGAFLADVAGGRLALPPFHDYLLYLVLPFKLLAGPIESPRLIGDLQTRLRCRLRNLQVGLPWIWLGLFMKYVIANRLLPATRLDLTDPWMALGTAAEFELKFYFDFAGYSFMAYGGALLCNLRLTLNFTHPFFARSVVVFWRHWHVSLGRFLSRYLLEPNLRHFGSHQAKLRLASSIFLVSALWHGGTFNYALWGLFHGACYYGYIRWFKERRVHRVAGVLAMLVFFVAGRFLAIDADTGRLLAKGAGLLGWQVATAHGQAHLTVWPAPVELKAMALALLFLASEYVSLQRYPKRGAYHWHRKPLVSLGLLAAFLWYGIDIAGLLYARI